MSFGFSFLVTGVLYLHYLVQCLGEQRPEQRCSSAAPPNRQVALVAMSDGRQSLTPDGFADMIRRLRPVAEAVGRKLPV